MSHVPLEAYLRALKGNKNIIHITLSHYNSESDVKRFHATICDLPPWVTSISYFTDSFEPLPAIHRDLLFIRSANNDLITFAKEIRLKLDPSSTYIFTDVSGSGLHVYSGKLGRNARILISFVGPTSGRLILRLKHSSSGYLKDGCLDVTLGSTIIQLNPPSELLIDEITLYPTREVPPLAAQTLLAVNCIGNHGRYSNVNMINS